MKDPQIRALIAITVVLTFSAITIVLVSLAAGGILDLDAAVDLLKHVSSVYSGFVGLVVGYYFARPA